MSEVPLHPHNGRAQSRQISVPPPRQLATLQPRLSLKVVLAAHSEVIAEQRAHAGGRAREAVGAHHVRKLRRAERAVQGAEAHHEARADDLREGPDGVVRALLQDREGERAEGVEARGPVPGGGEHRVGDEDLALCGVQGSKKAFGDYDLEFRVSVLGFGV